MPELNLNDDNFEAEVLQSEVPVLVDFFAEWCGPCKMQGPIVDELAEEMKDEKVKVGKLDVDQAPQTAQKYEVQSIPTLIIFKNGEVAEKMTGMKTKEDLKEQLKKVME